MTQLGEGVDVSSFTDEEEEGLFRLRFILLDGNGEAVSGVRFKTVKSGTSADPLHLADGETSFNGMTPVVSRTKDEEVDFFIAWAKLEVNKGFFKV